MTRPEPTSPAWDKQLLENPHAVADKRARVRKMFAAIAPSYDINNRLHSLWMDQRWRKTAVTLAALSFRDVVVDVACGTGDLTLAFARGLWNAMTQEHLRDAANHSDDVCRMAPKQRQVTGIDFTYEMLPLARQKGAIQAPFDLAREANSTARLLKRGLITKEQFDASRVVMSQVNEAAIGWINGDAQSLPLADASADVVSIAFGIRNVANPAAAMREFRRVLRPGGRLIILEFSLPTNPVLRGLYNFYFRQILPRTATLISGDKTGAYKYLPESVNTFIGREQMMSMMRDAGFTEVQQFPLTFGVCVCYRGFARD